MAKILIVDDAQTFRMELRSHLQKGGVHHVEEAGDGQQGLDVLSKNKDIQLIISDKNMPVMDGFEMCKLIKENPEFEKMPIIMLTTESSQDMKVKGKEIGITYWLTKPYNADRLLLVIDKIIAK